MCGVKLPMLTCDGVQLELLEVSNDNVADTAAAELESRREAGQPEVCFSLLPRFFSCTSTPA